MGHMRRYLQAGAIFAETLDDLQDIRGRYVIVGNPTMIPTARGAALHVSPGNNITATHQVGKFPHGAAGDFSISFRIRSTDANHVVLGNKRIDGDEKGFCVRFEDGPIVLKVGDGGSSTEITSATGVLDGLWHNVTFAVDRDGNSYVYVDGAQEGVVVALENGDDISSPLDLAIGCDALGSFDMTGDLREVLIWNRNLTQAEAEDIAAGRAFDY